MILSKTAINRPVTTWVLIIALVLLGTLSYFGLPVDLMPSMEVPVITVQVIYPGAGPEEIETNITKKIENEVYTVSGIDKVQSYVMEGGTQVVCLFDMDKDVDIANQEIKDKIDAIITDFPEDSYAPTIMKFDISSSPIVYLSFISTLSNKDAYKYVDENIKDNLARISGVSQVQLFGGQEREIHLLFNQKNLQKYKLSPLQLLQAVKTNNLNYPGGNITRQGTEYSVKVEGELESLTDIRNLRIPTPVGEKKLSEIVTIIDSAEKMNTLSRYKSLKNGSDKFKGQDISVINLEVKKQSDANTVAVAENVIAKVAKINEKLPENMIIEVSKDESVFVKSSVNDTLSSIFLGIILTAIILYIFLHGFNTTFIVGMSMPIVLIATFLLISGFDFSVNMMTLMALSVSVGTLVTNSVVILENIDRYIRMGMDRVEAADKGTAEIAVAVLASTLTNIVVFVPIATMESMVGQVFEQFGLTVTFIMILSIVVSFTATPMLASKMLKNKKEDEEAKGFGGWFDRMFEKISQFYRKIIEKIVKHWYTRIGVALFTIALLVHSVKFLAPNLGSEFVPFVDNGDMDISIEMPTFFDLDKTTSIFKEIENRVSKHNEDVETISSSIGKLGTTEGPYLGKIKLKLKKDRTQSTKDLAQILSEELANIPGALIKVSPITQFSGSGASPIQFDIMGTDADKVEELTKKVYQIALETEGTMNVDTDLRPGKPEIKLVPDRKMLQEYGMTVNDIGILIRTTINGLEISKFREDGEEYDIVLKSDQDEINDIEKIKSIKILTSKGFRRVDELCDISFEEAPTIIKRQDKLKKQTITSDASGRTPGVIVDEIYKRALKEIDIPENHFIKKGGDADMQEDSNKDFVKAFAIAIVLTFLLIAAILESWLQAILIMATIPMSFIGVFWSLYVMDVSINIFTMMAAVMLIGIVVNNAIIIFDYANILRNMGHDKVRAILEACQTKLKAIVMATLAAVLGMLPLALGLGDGAELRQGLGIVSVGGLIISAFLTLFVIPGLYVQFQRRRKPKISKKEA